jgi:LysM repeat protein
VNLANRTLTLFQNGAYVSTYPVAIGKPETPSPTGTFPILNKAYWPGGAFGSRWLGLTADGIGVHGTNVPSSIGLAVSNGCIRMYNQDVEAIWELLFVGDIVTIVAGAAQGGGTYTVQPGDTLFGIAQRFGTTVEAIMQANNLTSDVIYAGQTLVVPGAGPGPGPTPPPTPSPQPGTTTYTVQPGDTLYLIALRFNTSLGVLRQLNNLTSDIIYPGQTLLVPAQGPQQTYVVQPGDTLFGIARRFGTTVAELQRLNNLNTDVIYPGQVLRVA